MRLTDSDTFQHQYNLDTLYDYVHSELDELCRYIYAEVAYVDVNYIYYNTIGEHIEKHLAHCVFNFVKNNFNKYFATTEKYRQSVFETGGSITGKVNKSPSVYIIYHTLYDYPLNKCKNRDLLNRDKKLVDDLFIKEPDFAKECFTIFRDGLYELGKKVSMNKIMRNVGCEGENEKIIQQFIDTIIKNAVADYSLNGRIMDKNEVAATNRKAIDKIIEVCVRYAFSTYAPNPYGSGRRVLLAEGLMVNHNRVVLVRDDFRTERLWNYVDSMATHYLFEVFGFYKYLQWIGEDYRFNNHKNHTYWYWALETAKWIAKTNTEKTMALFKKNAKEQIKKYNDL